MGNPLNKAGTNDFYTAFTTAGILAAGNDSGWQGPYTGAQAFTIDPTLNAGIVTWKFNFSAAGTLTFTVTPSTTLIPGQRLRIVINTGIGYTVPLTMPSNFYFKRGVGFTAPAATRSTIEFQYDETTNAWYEIGDRASVPASTPVAAGWQNLSLSSGWAALAGWATPQYKIDTHGWVSFRGVITTAAGVAANANMFSLPSGFLPASNEAAGNSIYTGAAVAAGMVTFLTSGTAQTLVAVGAGGFIPLTSLRYQID